MQERKTHYICVQSVLLCLSLCCFVSVSHEHEVKIEVEELPHSGNTQSVETKVDSAPTEEEKRADRRRERRRRRRLENEGAPTHTVQSARNKFEKRSLVDNKQSQKTNTSQDSMASSETQLSPTGKFTLGEIK